MRVTAPGFSPRPVHFRATSPQEDLEIYLPPALEIPPEPERPSRGYGPPAQGLLIYGGLAGGAVFGWMGAARQGWVGAGMGALCGLVFAPTAVTLTAIYLDSNAPLGHKPTLSPMKTAALTAGLVVAGAALGWVDGRLGRDRLTLPMLSTIPMACLGALGAGITPSILWDNRNDRRHNREMQEFHQAVADRKAALERQQVREAALDRLKASRPVAMEFEEDAVVVGDFELPTKAG